MPSEEKHFAVKSACGRKIDGRGGACSSRFLVWGIKYGANMAQIFRHSCAKRAGTIGDCGIVFSLLLLNFAQLLMCFGRSKPLPYGDDYDFGKVICHFTKRQ